MGGQLAKIEIPNTRRQQHRTLSETHFAGQQQQHPDQLHSNLTASSTLVVVNRGPGKSKTSATTTSSSSARLPALQAPLIPVGQAVLQQTIYPHLHSQPLFDLALEFQNELRRHAEGIANEQRNLIERVKDTDQQLEKVSSTYAVEKQRRLNRAKENFDKLGEIETLVERCQADIEHLIGEFVRLNRGLPEHLRLEDFSLQQQQ